MRIIVACAAGVSSTFLVHRVRHAIQVAGLAHTVEVGTTPESVAGADVLVLAEYVDPATHSVAVAAQTAGIRIVTLPADTRRLDPEAFVASLTPRNGPMHRDLTVASSHGLHARPASLLAKAVTDSGATVTIAKEGGNPVNAGSILAVLALGVSHGERVTLTVADVDDAEAVLDRLAAFLNTDHDAPGAA